jgi:hypothetical protein
MRTVSFFSGTAEVFALDGGGMAVVLLVGGRLSLMGKVSCELENKGRLLLAEFVNKRQSSFSALRRFWLFSDFVGAGWAWISKFWAALTMSATSARRPTPS